MGLSYYHERIMYFRTFIIMRVVLHTVYRNIIHDTPLKIKIYFFDISIFLCNLTVFELINR